MTGGNNIKWTDERRRAHGEIMRRRLPIEKVCIDCETPFVSRSYRSVRCATCQTYEDRFGFVFRKLARTYGISLEELMTLYGDGTCNVCGSAPDQGHRRLVADHDHNTGRLRGFLCHSCNLVLGKVHDDPIVLTKMIEYLTKPQAPEVQQ